VLRVNGWPHSHVEVSLTTTLHWLWSKKGYGFIVIITVILFGALTMLMASCADIFALPLALRSYCR
jgi:hypothetical protein